MHEFTIRIAERTVQVSAEFENTAEYCRDYLHTGEPDFRVRITTEDLAYEEQKNARENPGICFPDAYLETVAVQRKIAEKLFDYDVLLFHGSALAMDSAGYLFTAPSGTGKSTHARLWREVFGDRVQTVNDDKPFLLLDHDRAEVCGSPWNGKHGLGSNIQVPLKAICILERGVSNTITPLEPREALFMLLQQSNRPRQSSRMGKYLELIDRLTSRVRFYRLSCNMEPEAAVVAQKVLSQA